MQIKEWMIGGPIVIIVALGSLYLTASMQNDREQTNIDTSGIANVAKGDTTGGDCDKGIIAVVKTWNLSNELREISGIVFADSNRVATIEDTRGTVFIYNLADEKIEKEIKFSQHGDYEGIAYANGSYFILRADGYLFEIDKQGKVLHEYDLPLDAKDDTESLFYDAPNNRLLVGQKEGGKDIVKKGIFAFDLKTRKFNPDPVYSFDPNVSFCDSILSSKGKKKGSDKIVKPSDIAIHPITHEIFVADGPNQRILVLSPEGTPLYFLKLDKIFEQPEGLMFSPSGDFYISTEGIRRPANISKVTVPAMIQ